MKTIFSRTPQSLFSRKNCIVLILILAAASRLFFLPLELQYDELWSLIHFTKLDVSKILTDIALPNNHPVNTLILKLLQKLSMSPWILRLGVFSAGLGTVALIMLTAAAIAGQTAAVSSGILAATAMQLILFSATARGYIYQLLALLLCVYALIRHVRGANPRWTILGLTIGGVLSFITVSSGIMFLAIIGLGYLLLAPPGKRMDKTVFTAGIILLIAAGGYYLSLYDKLRAGQQWGIEIDSFTALLKFIWHTLKAHMMPFTALLVLAGIHRHPSLRKVFLLSLLPLLLSPLTKGGPERVYLLLSAVYIIIAGCGFETLWQRFVNRRKLLAAGLLAGAVLNFAAAPEVWDFPTPAADLCTILENSSDDLLPVMPSTSGFPAMMNAPEAARQLEIRAMLSPGWLLAVRCENGVFNGADPSTAEITETFPVSGIPYNGPIPGRLYKLIPLPAPESGTAMLAMFPGNMVPENFLNLPGKKLRINLGLNRRIAIYICTLTGREIPQFEYTKFFKIGAEQ